MQYLIIFFVSFAVTLYIQRVIIKFSKKNEIKRRVDVVRNSKCIKPRLGGIGIFLGFLVSVSMISFISELRILDSFKFPDISNLGFYFISLFIIFILGLIDDLFGLNAWQKLPVELIAATLLFVNGFSIKLISLPFAPGKISLPFILSFFLTILWIVGITNAMNLIDGIDGLAGGIALCSSISFVIISLLNHKPQYALLASLIIGPLIAFLIYNFYPSKIHMGDSGSLVLGFFLASLSLKASTKASFGITFIIPVLILFVPILDTSISFFRRALSHKNPFKADEEHIHHKLFKRINSEKTVFYILMFWELIFSIIGIMTALVSKPFRLIFIGFLIIFTFFVIKKLKYFKVSLDKKR